jgi:hypothetical protein
MASGEKKNTKTGVIVPLLNKSGPSTLMPEITQCVILAIVRVG